MCVEVSPLIEVYSELAACLMLRSLMKGREKEKKGGYIIRVGMADLLKAVMGEKLGEKQDGKMGGGGGGLGRMRMCNSQQCSQSV